MGLIDDVSRFLEQRIDEFLKNNPHLELQALDEKLREQDQETARLLVDLQSREKAAQAKILSTAEEIKMWHVRIQKAQAAGRTDLAQPAQAHEATLLRTGNQIWGQMEVLKDRIVQTQELQGKIHVRRQELKVQIDQVQAARIADQAAQAAQTADQTRNTAAWSTPLSSAADPLDQKFRSWEAEEELNRMKRDTGR
jgi:uncharacterized protein (TIGR04376 family)